ncbi:MAG TPA: L-fucose/L-arabinose isomerase family protein [Acidimicrobiales bacterium]|nr:L-fucose/L-arabinose isomerase family protein [Acidimicrobiales bacterium]
MSTAPLPRIGLLGIMQELYDEMIPRITEHQAAFARELVERCAGVAELSFSRPARNQSDIEEIVKDLQSQDLDGIMIVMLTYGPALRTVRALMEQPLPVLLANIQPISVVTGEWDMSDLTYNQGIHGAQDQSNALLRAGLAYSVITEDWHSEAFLTALQSWARAAQTVTKLKRTRIALFGYPMNGMEDVLYDPTALVRKIGPMVVNESLGVLHRALEAVSQGRIDELVAALHERYEVDPALSAENLAYAARFELGLRDLLEAGRYDGFSAHFEPLGNDGRFRQLPLLASSDLMADGYGFGAEGDTNACALVCASHTLIGDAHFSEMYAMDFDLDSVLISHMGEGNPKVARRDRPVRLIDRPLGIGGLDNPPTALFSAQPGTATTATLIPLDGELYRLAVGVGEVLDTPVLPKLEMPYFHFRPESGMRRYLDGWLRAGGTHHFVTNLGDHLERWRLLAELLDIDFVEL